MPYLGEVAKMRQLSNSFSLWSIILAAAGAFLPITGVVEGETILRITIGIAMLSPLSLYVLRLRRSV